MLVKMYINAHYICAMCRNSKSVAKKVAIFSSGVIRENEFTFNSENVIIFIIMRANVIKRKTGKNYHV